MNAQGDLVAACGGHVVVWSGGDPTVLPPLNPNDWCFAYGINAFGQVAGFCYAAGFTAMGSPSVAVLWTDGQPEKLWGNPQNFDQAYARALNDAGVVVGVQRGAALEWLPDQMKSVKLAPAGAANAVNQRGDVIGYVGDWLGVQRATLWRADGTEVPFGLLDGGSSSWGRDINDDGLGTGMAVDAEGHEHAVLFRP